ncbi:MAG: hypothetical protein AABW73_00330 [Nanoarchaeota archaeon]
MEKGVSQSGGRRKVLTLIGVFLVVGLLSVILLYRGGITSKVTGEVVKDNVDPISESDAVNRLVSFLNTKYGDAKFFRSEDLGSVYLVVIEHDGQKYDFFITKDGRYFSNFMEKLELDSASGNVSSS